MVAATRFGPLVAQVTVSEVEYTLVVGFTICLIGLLAFPQHHYRPTDRLRRLRRYD